MASSVKSKRDSESHRRRKMRREIKSNVYKPRIERSAKMNPASSAIKTNCNKDGSVNAEVQPRSSWKIRQKIERLCNQINAIPANKTEKSSKSEFRREVLSVRPRYVAMSSQQSEGQTEFKIVKTTAVMVSLFILLVYPRIILIIFTVFLLRQT